MKDAAEVGMAYAIKAEVGDREAAAFAFEAQKTMYGGKNIRRGDEIFVFASENQGGRGLVLRAVVTSAEPVERHLETGRQTPRVTVALDRLAVARRPLGRAELRTFRAWGDGRPETELNFKLYRQATNKIVGLSDATAAFLRSFF